MTRKLVGFLVVLVASAPGGARAAEPDFAAPRAHGVVDFGERVRFEVRTGAPCEAVRVSTVVRTDDHVYAGEDVTGCSGVIQIPREGNLALAGIAEEDPIALAIVADDGTDTIEQPLRLERFQAEHAQPVSGTFGTSPAADDPFGGGRALDVTGSGSTISLRSVDLSGVSSMAIRVASAGARVCAGVYCRTGRAVARAGSPFGPLVTAWEIPATTPSRPWQRMISEPLRIHPAGPVEIFVTFLESIPGSCGPVQDLSTPLASCTPDKRIARVNYFEFIGSGVAEPFVFPPDPDGTVWLFDGSSLDGWQLAGCCGFLLEPDGSMRSFGGYGLLWNAKRTFADFVLRLEFKVDGPDANSGIFVRFPDPQGNPTAPSSQGYEVQVQDYGQAYPGSSDLSQTGAIYSFAAAERIATRSVGEWNAVEMTAAGQNYTVRLNGRIVTRFTGQRALDGHIGVQCHDPSGTVWYRRIRVIPLA